MRLSDESTAAAAFREAYGRAPECMVRAPGRVNLIGEHTDYSGLPVLPIAIERSVWVAAARAPDPVIRACSTRFPVPAELPETPGSPSAPWHRYLDGAVAELQKRGMTGCAQLLIDSDLPAEGGLSSSSALTVGVLAALSSVWGATLTSEDLLPLAISAERYAGVESGGMDQEVILNARAGNALRIDFRPPGRRLVPTPPGLSFVAAYSGEAAPKGGVARDRYNALVVGARMAAALLADQLGVDLELPPTLGQVADVDVVDIIVDELPPKISAREVAHGASVNAAVLVQLSHRTVSDTERFPVRPVARHILSEAARVDQAEQALLASDLRAFGRILDASHRSLHDDLGTSTPGLDRLCKAMRKAGAFGARPTGAGFGGFAVAACPPAAVPFVVEAAIGATGGPAFEVHASDGYEILA